MRRVLREALIAVVLLGLAALWGCTAKEEKSTMPPKAPASAMGAITATSGVVSHANSVWRSPPSPRLTDEDVSCLYDGNGDLIREARIRDEPHTQPPIGGAWFREVGPCIKRLQVNPMFEPALRSDCRLKVLMRRMDDEKPQPSPPPDKWGGGPDVGRIPPEAGPVVGPNGEGVGP